ncbi:DUF6299 family protein [Kitasatospora kifunensis]|uniref:DUF6299 domain-containing protein n=1 Tax=Kitasatospora kifunensis TaxID=58351 RepID=A0A7W7VXY0_KITKI|nr:DUF6299 family protein [Kitasatospora kifunensis]MBB4926986.1 hypothetical protein [Kitasatospora kifunensis]
MRVRPTPVRVRPRVAGLLGAALLALLGAATPAGAAAGETLSVARMGVIASDGTVTLTGTYRCSTAGAVYVTSNLRVGQTQTNIGNGVRATCDGNEHSWTSQGKPAQLHAQPGPARVEATLTHLTQGPAWWLPVLPEFLAQQSQDIMLVADGS